MPWSNNGSGGPWGGGGSNGGGSGGGGSPWGGGKGDDKEPGKGGNNWGGNRSNKPPDLEEMLRRGQDRLKKVMPGGSGGRFSGLGVGILVLLGFIGWMLTGLYTVRQNEIAINLVFGKYAGKEGPGLKYNWPYPIGSVEKREVTNINSMDIGGQTGAQGTQNNRNQALPGDSSLMLTGDERIVDIDFTVFWKIKETAPEEFVFNLLNPESTIRAVAQSVMREVVGRSELSRIVSGATSRSQIEQDVKTQMQAVLDNYKAGVAIDSVAVRTADVPGPVVDSFRDVVAAQQDSERARNEALTYQSQVLPAAQAEANRMIQSAEAYRSATVAEARGQASRFTQIYEEYKKAPAVTRERLFYETWERLFASTDKIIVDSQGGQGVVPYLPLDQLQRRPVENAAPAQAPQQ